MNPALWVAKTGLDAQQTKINVVSNNLANVNTTGFKKDRASFEDLLYQKVRQPGGLSSQNTELPSGLMLGTGVKVTATEKLHSQGNMLQTGNSYDAAVAGRGFFQILLPDGSIGYTRDGSFQVNNQGQVVTSSGFQLQPAITVSPEATSVTIGRDGTVTQQIQGQASAGTIGNIQLVDFINPSGLEPIGENLFTETGASGSPQAGTPGLNGLGNIRQGMLESSNVNIVEEMVNMIETQRAYETNAKAITVVDQMLQYVNNNL